MQIGSWFNLAGCLTFEIRQNAIGLRIMAACEEGWRFYFLFVSSGDVSEAFRYFHKRRLFVPLRFSSGLDELCDRAWH